MLKQEKGITLVALVLVIVVLLILSGVAISVVIQNSDNITPNSSLNSNNNPVTSYNEAYTKVKLVFELQEANYQTELAKGNVANRGDFFTATNIIKNLQKYNITGNTEASLGEIDLVNGITVKYGGEYTFLVRISSTGIITVLEK